LPGAKILKELYPIAFTFVHHKLNALAILLYNIFLIVYTCGIRIASLYNPKAKKWLQGRKNIFDRLEAALPKNEKIIWVHCSSLGEFEQGRPVIERLKTQGKNYKILLTFFSPSGYEVQKHFNGADWVFYLPMDGAGNAKRFLEIVNPSLVIFVKYDYWFYYLKKIKNRNIPLLLISALFQKNSVFFHWYGFFQRKMLNRFDHVFVQNEESKRLLDIIGLSGKCTVAGDTRFDRVMKIADQFEPIPLIEEFIGSQPCLVAGSTWKEDEALLSQLILPGNELKLIMAPHELSFAHVKELKKQFPGSITYSEFVNNRNLSPATVLIIDSMGMLSRLYKYATITYVGGGLTRNGVHNVLEAAVYGKPVLHGPVFQKYREAMELVEAGGAIIIKNANELKAEISILLNNGDSFNKICEASRNYVQKNKGATDKIMAYIQEKRLLTN
jgi:3-deoxy-D-manno-octulosonic-acid transferase